MFMRINLHIERCLTSLISTSYSCERIVMLVRAKNREPPTGSRCCRLDEKPPVALFAAIFARCKGGGTSTTKRGRKWYRRSVWGKGDVFCWRIRKAYPA